MFAPSGNNFKVYKSSSDFEEYIDKAKNVPANELYPIQQEFMKKAIDTVLYRMPRVTKQPSSLAEIKLTKNNVAIIKSLVKKMMKEAKTAKTSNSSQNQEIINRINKVSSTSARQELLKAFNAGQTIDI
jgi:ribosome-binding ATPase YchF (GTP1/OBG family)